MSYLPPGWTQERLADATVDDLLKLPYETLYLIPPLAPSSRDAQNLIFGARLDEKSRLERGRFKLPPIPPRFKPRVVSPEDENPNLAVRAAYVQRKQQTIEKERQRYLEDPSHPFDGSKPNKKPNPTPSANVDAVVQVVEAAGYEKFGFTIVRMDYRDDEDWGKWASTVDKSIEQAVAACKGGNRIVDKSWLSIAEDPEELEGQDLLQALAYHDALLDEEKVEPGLQASMILVADQQAVDSLLRPKQGKKPWVWAVDISYRSSSERFELLSADFTSDEYPGFFRVTPEAAYTELWPLLMNVPPETGFLGVTGARVWRPDVDVWEGIV